MDRVENVLRFASCSGVGPRTYKRLIDVFGTTEEILGASVASLSAVEGVGPQKAQAIARCASHDPRPEMELAASKQVRILTQSDPDYPRALRETFDPPIVLYVRGDLRPTDLISIAIVGTRVPSPYGRAQAARFSSALARCGFTVVSGLARGIDSVAHHGALDGHGRTVAVLGTGINKIYPEENRDLAAEILHSGAVVTEFPMNMGPSRENFPRRNRIIAALSLGTLVIEAPIRSGALITARFATEAGREVFAIPGRISDPGAEGGNRLIANGQAKLVTDLEGIFEEVRDVADALRASNTMAAGASCDPLIPPMGRIVPADAESSRAEDSSVQKHVPKNSVPRKKTSPPSSASSTLPTKEHAPPASASHASKSGTATATHGHQHVVADETVDIVADGAQADLSQAVAYKDSSASGGAFVGLSEQEARIFQVLSDERKHIDAICDDCGLPVYQVSSGLMLLELKRRVTQHPGKFFSRSIT